MLCNVYLQVTIITDEGKIISRSKTVAESAKIHPTKPIIALKGICCQ